MSLSKPVETWLWFQHVDCLFSNVRIIYLFLILSTEGGCCLCFGASQGWFGATTSRCLCNTHYSHFRLPLRQCYVTTLDVVIILLMSRKRCRRLSLMPLSPVDVLYIVTPVLNAARSLSFCLLELCSVSFLWLFDGSCSAMCSSQRFRLHLIALRFHQLRCRGPTLDWLTIGYLLCLFPCTCCCYCCCRNPFAVPRSNLLRFCPRPTASIYFCDIDWHPVSYTHLTLPTSCCV